MFKERLHTMAPQSKHKSNPTRNSKKNVKKVDLALTTKHFVNIHEGLEGDEIEEHVKASKEVGFKLWQVSKGFINQGPLVVSYTSQYLCHLHPEYSIAYPQWLQ